MQQHYCDTDNVFPLESFQHLELQHYRNQERTTLLSVDAQVVSDEFLMRSQTWILLPWSRRDKFIAELAENIFLFDICVHTGLGSLEKELVSELVKPVLDQLEAGENCRTQTLQCPYCWMDYMLDAVDFEERGFAVLVTRWVNLGAGLDSADAKWQSHTTCTPGDGHRPHARGEIREDFEDQAEVTVEELTTDKKLKPFSKREDRLIYQGSDGLFWQWDQGIRWYQAPSGPHDRTFWQFLRDGGE